MRGGFLLGEYLSRIPGLALCFSSLIVFEVAVEQGEEQGISVEEGEPCG